MSSTKLQAAILIISTTAARDPAKDDCISILRGVFESDCGNTSSDSKWSVIATKIVTDDVLEIQRAITAWTDGEDRPNLIVTSGGTGFAVWDITPEVREVNDPGGITNSSM